MSYFGLNSEYVETKNAERLCAPFKEENEKMSSDLSIITSATDSKQVLLMF